MSASNNNNKLPEPPSPLDDEDPDPSRVIEKSRSQWKLEAKEGVTQLTKSKVPLSTDPRGLEEELNGNNRGIVCSPRANFMVTT